MTPPCWIGCWWQTRPKRGWQRRTRPRVVTLGDLNVKRVRLFHALASKTTEGSLRWLRLCTKYHNRKPSRASFPLKSSSPTTPHFLILPLSSSYSRNCTLNSSTEPRESHTPTSRTHPNLAAALPVSIGHSAALHASKPRQSAVETAQHVGVILRGREHDATIPLSLLPLN